MEKSQDKVEKQDLPLSDFDASFLSDCSHNRGGFDDVLWMWHYKYQCCVPSPDSSGYIRCYPVYVVSTRVSLGLPDAVRLLKEWTLTLDELSICLVVPRGVLVTVVLHINALPARISLLCLLQEMADLIHSSWSMYCRASLLHAKMIWVTRWSVLRECRWKCLVIATWTRPRWCIWST